MTYELLVGATPFGDASKEAVEARIRSAAPSFPKSMSPEAQAFVASALEKHPGDRPTIQQMLDSALLAKHRGRPRTAVAQ